MNRLLVVLLGALLLMIPSTSLAQVPNEGLANAVVAARQKNAALLQNYNWNCRTEIDKDGDLQDLRIDLVNLGPDGTLQRSLLNDQPGSLPGGFLRKRIAENKRRDLEGYVSGLGKLVDEYTLPGPGKIASFLVQAQVQPVTTPDGKTVLQVTGSSVVVPGDSFSMTLDGTKLLPQSIQISTTFNGEQVTVSATCKTLASGLNTLQYATVTVPDRNITVNIHNYDYVTSD